MPFLLFVVVLCLFRSTGFAQALASEPRAVHYEAGAVRGTLAEPEAVRAGLTLVDLSDAFVPSVLAEEPALGELGYPPYAETYRALADERFDERPLGERARELRYLELYGIFPNFRVLRARLLDQARQRCDGGVDRAPLAAYEHRLSLAPAPASAVRSPAAQQRRAALETVHALLRCEGLLASAPQSAPAWALRAGLRAFQRKTMVVSVDAVDATTRARLMESAAERDFTAALRALRERVVAATGAIEDGSAASEQAEVVGRRLDAAELRGTDERGPLAGAAPDWIGRATDAAARALGWTSPEALAQWFGSAEAASLATLHVALRLPPLPDYHAAHMELRAEIDRGDVWYDYPYRPDGTRRSQPVSRRPTLVLYVKTPTGEIPLLRWNTTIGGFQPEKLEDGRIVYRYKESEPGARVWREILAAPTWMPPDSTPDRDLVTPIGHGRYALKRDVFGPGFESAYGMVMLRHELVWSNPKDAAPQYWDRGVRTHGSVSYMSILHGQSHGCHRLFNHLALRLAGFLVAHRNHVHHGVVPVRYSRRVLYRNVRQLLSITTRGYGYELTPPVPVLVLEGSVRGQRKQPIESSMPLPPDYTL